MTKIFCPHVYNALEINTGGTFKPCCISSKQYSKNGSELFRADTDSVSAVYNSDDRQDFINNFDTYFTKHCKQCAEVEASGGESKRLREIKYWDLYYASTEQPFLDNHSSLEVLDLKLGNTCNLACATCDPLSSSKWNSIIKKETGSFPVLPQHWPDSDVFWYNLLEHVNHVKKIEIAGGEPFMNKKQKILLNYLVDNDIAKNIDITWITNCTFYEEDIVILLKQFKRVRIMLSLDNTDEQFEYMRYPAKWNESYEIFKKFKALEDSGDINLGISHSISMLNIWRLPEFWSWAREHRVNVFNNLIMWPFSCKELPIEYKLIVKNKLEEVTDPSYQSNPAVGSNNWLVEFMMQDSDPTVKNRLSEHHQFVKRSRPDGLFEAAFPELIGIM